jgi:hypothetical protein
VIEIGVALPIGSEFFCAIRHRRLATSRDIHAPNAQVQSSIRWEQRHVVKMAIASMGPVDMFFTTPTLNDAIPATIQGSTVSADCIQLHEDDWRQFEFIPHSLKREVAAEMVDISLIWDKHHVSIGDGVGMLPES